MTEKDRAPFHAQRNNRKRFWLLLILIIALGPYVYSRFKAPGRRVRIVDMKMTGVAPTFNGRLKIVTYNIAHGRGTAAISHLIPLAALLAMKSSRPTFQTTVRSSQRST